MDIREHGSGNLGGTNTFRVLGKPAGLIVTSLDILKGTAATLLPLLSFFADTTVHPLILRLHCRHWPYVPAFCRV